MTGLAAIAALLLAQDFPGALGDPITCRPEETVTRCLERQGLAGAIDAPLVEGTPDAGAVALDVVRGRFLQADGGLVKVTDGAWFSTDELVRQAAARKAARVENAHLVEHAGDVPFKWIVGAMVVGIAVGASTVVSLECAYGSCFGLKGR